MSGSIRVRFSGALLFTGNLVTLLTGFIFNVLIARNLPQPVLGTWFFIGSVLPYFQVLEKAIPYWAGRDIPRGEEVGKTTLLFNTAISIPITLVFILLSNTLSSIIESEPRTFILASTLIPVYYISAALTTITYSTAPHKLGLRTIIIDSVKIPLAFILLPYGLEGIVAAVTTGNIAYTLYLLKTNQQHLKHSFNKTWLRNSLKKIWIPLHENLLGYISTATDSFIIGVLLTATDLSHYGIALAIASIIGTAKGLTGTIYPKLLKTKTAQPTELKALFKFLHIFTTPMIIGGITLSKQLTEIFGTRYIQAAPLLPMLLTANAIGITTLTMKTVITALEKSDTQNSSKQLLKSTLFTTQLPSYLSLATLITVTAATAGPLGIHGAAAARLASSITGIIPMVLIYAKKAPPKTIFNGLEKTVPASIAMAITLLIINPVGTIQTLASIAIGAATYFAFLLLIDKDARQLAKQAVEEARRLILTSSD